MKIKTSYNQEVYLTPFEPSREIALKHFELLIASIPEQQQKIEDLYGELRKLQGQIDLLKSPKAAPVAPPVSGVPGGGKKTDRT